MGAVSSVSVQVAPHEASPADSSYSSALLFREHPRIAGAKMSVLWFDLQMMYPSKWHRVVV